MVKAKNPMRRSWLDETDGGWVPHTLTLKVSPAWRHRPIPLVNLLERIEIEHLRHGGAENGRLIVTYDQFVEHGMSRRTIRGSLALGEALGLLEVRQSGEWAGDIRAPNTYRMTYLPEKGRRAPTDEWKSVSNEEAKLAVAQYQQELGKKPISQCQKSQATSTKSGRKPTPTSAKSDKSPVPEMELLYISPGIPSAGGGVTSPLPTPDLSAVADIATDVRKTCGDPVALTGHARSLLRWMQHYRGLPTHRTAQQNLSGTLKGDEITAAAETLRLGGLLTLEEVPNSKGTTSKVYRLTDEGRDRVLARPDDGQTDLVDWLDTARE